MTAYRLPGVLRGLTNALPIDAGTRARANMAPPVSLGRNVEGKTLSDQERDLIEKCVGKDMQGNSLPLPVLLIRRQEHVQRREDALSQFGPQSGVTLIEEA